MTKSAAAIRRDHEKAFIDMLNQVSGVGKSAMKVRRLTIAARIVYCVESDELDKLVHHEYENYRIEVRGRRVAMFWQKRDVQPVNLLVGRK